MIRTGQEAPKVLFAFKFPVVGFRCEAAYFTTVQRGSLQIEVLPPLFNCLLSIASPSR